MANNCILLSKVFMEAADPILIEDLAGNVIDLNQAAEQTYGWTREEIVGRPIRTIVPHTELSRITMYRFRLTRSCAKEP